MTIQTYLQFISPDFYLALFQQTNIKHTENRVYGDRFTTKNCNIRRRHCAICKWNNIKKVRNTNCLGLSIDKFQTWDTYMQSIKHKVTSSLGVIKRTKPFVTQENLITLYRLIVESRFSYCCIVCINYTLPINLQRLQSRATRIITGTPYSKRSADIRASCAWLLITKRDETTTQGYNDV